MLVTLAATENAVEYGEWFDPIVKRMAALSLPKSVAAAVSDVQQRISTMCAGKHNRPLLQLLAKQRAPIPLRIMNPLLEDNFAPGRGETEELREKQRARSLKRQVRRETRAVARELKKDTLYVADLRDAEAAERDEERTAKTKEVMSFLEEQHATFKDMVRQGVARGGGVKRARPSVR